MTEVAPTALTRRTVLAGVGAAGLVSATAVATAAPSGRRAVVGVLTPAVPGKPGVAARGDALHAGLRVGLGGTATKVLRGEVPFGLYGAEDEAERLLAGGARVLVTGLSDPIAQRLVPLCTEHGAALVVANAGAHVVADRSTAKPAVLHNSMQHWAAALSLGNWAARHLGTSMHAVVAAPDAGYDSVFALRRGFTGGGGTVAGLTVTHNGVGLDDMVAEVRASRAAVVGVSASGQRALRVVKTLRAAGVTSPILLDALALEAGGLASLGRHGRGVHMAASALDVAAWARLRTALRSAGASRPDAYAVLGHDTGVLVAAGAARLGGRSWTRLPAVLAGSRIRGVRGQMVVHQRLGTVSTPLAVSKVRSAGGATKTIATRPRIGGVAPALAVVTGRNVGGYVNEYQTT